MQYKIYGKTYKVKPITILEFLNSESLIPIRLFDVIKPLSRHELLRSEIIPEQNIEDLKIQEESRLKALKIIVSNCVPDISDIIDKFFEDDFASAFKIFLDIINLSELDLTTIYQITTQNAIYIDQMARRYCKTPSEIVSLKNKSDVFNYLFNEAIYIQGIKYENEQIKQQQIAAKRG